ncbi:MGH1-like glycoside hydrolase domain-containing protein [Paenibacillus beijingensis]|uniref:Mannosylglycerate hydrolase MGH1-like glycoside hydrolase domain-containing protein n=1 Tax=Paenibacillus beijingensis TaxID=1126833 RepID=A0A0D5NK81_9BACL|nr:hypothetical protein [Paenibacillus beijingensis]AJY75338.1 hypothetical protein VN24_13100 [Paenibacillus beijingensis]
MTISFTTDNPLLNRKVEAAIQGLISNTRPLFGYREPVLIEGGIYAGIWLECGPLESTVYGMIRPDIARACHDIFFANQREDGYIPAVIFKDRCLEGQIQMVVPIAATAYETALKLEDEAFLERSYLACSRWDRWLGNHRNTRGTGLCELFCEWDSGHDNSPRLTGIPHACPEFNAAICNDSETLPYLAPDLSATVYGGRIALAAMANRLGRHQEASEWSRKAEHIRAAILKYCFDEDELFFYDLDNKNQFVRVKGDIITRILGEHVVDQEMFERIFHRHICNPERFWSPFPFPSIALDEPAFNHDFSSNAWSGASQALTALRAPRWMEHYGKPAHLNELMKRWVSAIVDDDGFKQQMNPWTGQFHESEGYSPTMCVLIEFISRLYGIRSRDGLLEWNCHMPAGTTCSHYSLSTVAGLAEMKRTREKTTILLNGTAEFEVSGSCRVVTDRWGEVDSITGTRLNAEQVSISWPDSTIIHLSVEPNETVKIQI